MTIRAELEKMGPEAVRRAMVAFEHRAPGKRCGQPVCCFLTHAFGSEHDVTIGRKVIARRGAPVPLVEAAFEYDYLVKSRGWDEAWWDGTTRADLHSECIAYLAEHGDAIENRPARQSENISVGVGEDRPAL